MKTVYNKLIIYHMYKYSVYGTVDGMVRMSCHFLFCPVWNFLFLLVLTKCSVVAV